MRKMIGYEVKKIIKNKIMIVLIIVGLVFNAMVIHQNDFFGIDPGYLQAKAEVNRIVKGKITQEKYDVIYQSYQNCRDIVDNGNYETSSPSDQYYTGFVFGDMNLFREYLEGYEFAIHYHDQLQETIELAEANLKILKDEKDIERNKQFIQTFQQRSIARYYVTDNMTKFLSHDGSTFLIIVLLIITLSGMFAEDKEYQYDQILYTTELGHTRMFQAKLAAALLITFLLCVLFYTSDYLIYSHLDVLEGFSNPIYSLPDFQYAAVSLSIGSFLVLTYIARFLCIAIAALIICMISYANKKVLLSMLCSCFLLMLLMYRIDIVYDPFVLCLVRYTLTSFQMGSFFGFDLANLYQNIVICAVELLLLLCMIFVVKRYGKGVGRYVKKHRMGNQ